MRAVSPRAGPLVLFCLSGVPGLAAQIAWARVFSAGLGHEAPALVGVVTAFFFGLALGGCAMDRRLARSRNPLRAYALLEFVSGGWILLSSPGLSKVNEWARDVLGLAPSVAWQSLISFAVPLLIVGPAAVAMGGTLPAMDRALARLGRDQQRTVALLYALNCAGAVGGVVITVLVLMPQLGLRWTLMVAVLAQLFCGAGGWLISRQTMAVDSSRVAATDHGIADPGSRLRLFVVTWATGLLGIGFELLGVRALAQTTENTIYTFAAVLAVFLVGTAVGSALLHRWNRQGRLLRLDFALMGLGAVCIGEMWIVARSSDLLTWVRSWSGPFAAECVLAVAVFLVPTIFMGGIFAHVVQSLRRASDGVGRASGWNTLGAALAGPLFMGLAVPLVGLKGGFTLVASGYFVLGLFWWRGPQLVFGILGAVVLVLCGPRKIQLLELPSGATVLRELEGHLARVSVIRTADSHRLLRVNNHFQQGGTATAAAARRHAHLPLLLHPKPRNVLFLGVGTGITMGAASAYPGLQVDGVELLPEVVEVLKEFEPENTGLQRRPGFRLFTADARRYVRGATNRYDVIIADLFHPAEDGAGFLYTRDHFAAMRSCMAEGGLVCQWLPLHQLGQEVFRDVVRTFSEVFPHASLWMLRFNIDVPVVGLIGGGRPLQIDPGELEKRLADPGLEEALRPVALNSAVRVIGCLVASSGSLKTFAQTGSVGTDDLPVVLFRAPAALYRGLDQPGRRLLEVLEWADPDFSLLLQGADRESWVSRLVAFRSARDLHLKGLVRHDQSDLRGAVEDFIASAAASPEYNAGYAQAVLVASAYARENPGLAREILTRLIAARPEERLAREVLGRLP